MPLTNNPTLHYFKYNLRTVYSYTPIPLLLFYHLSYVINPQYIIYVYTQYIIRIYTQSNLKWAIYLNAKAKTKTSKEKQDRIKSMLEKTIFFDKTQKNTIKDKKNEKLHFIKIKNLYFSKDTVKKMKS